MNNVIQFVVHRQPNEKTAQIPASRGVPLSPTPALNSSNARTGAAPDLDFGAAGRILPQRWLSSLKAYLAVERKGRKAAGPQMADAAERAFASLHADLHRAYQLRDATRLERLASAHLEKATVQQSAGLMPQTIYLFFKAKGCSATAQELRDLAARYSAKELTDFLAGSAELVSQLKAQALAAIVNGTLVHQPIDLLFQIKAILAFQVVAKAVLDGPTGNPPIPVKLVCEMLDIDIVLPEWTFDIDPCRWHAQPGPTGATGDMLAGSPLRRRIEAQQKAGELRTDMAHAAAEPGAAGGPPQESDASADECSCEEDRDPPCLPPDPCCARINYFITDTLVLRDRTVRYLPSDLAYIENIAASESRTREHGFARTIEDYSEEEITTTKSEERDHQVTEKAGLQKEIETELKASADLNAKYDGGKYSLEVNAAVSKETAQREAREQVRESVDKAVSKLQVETRKLSSRRVTTTEDEKNIHVFDNSDGDDHIVAKYFYVSKEVEGQVFSHGVRTTVELLIPAPAALYQHLESVKIERSFPLSKPKPWDIEPDDINRDNYKQFGETYGVGDLPAPPEKPADPLPDTRAINADIPATKKEPSQSIEHTTIAARPGFYISQFYIDGGIGYDEVFNQRLSNMRFDIGGIDVWRSYSKKDQLTDGRDDSGPVRIAGPVPLVIITTNVDQLSATLVLIWKAEEPDLTEWRKTVWTKLRDAWQRLSDEYRKGLAEHERRERERIAARHPFADKEILLAELKRAAIYMMCQEFERGGVMNMKSQPCGYPEINRKAAAETCWDWYFWERAFDWRLMSFSFYDYFWNRMCDWPDKFDPGHGNFMFNAFLRSGMARLLIPVSPAMTGDVIFYLETGQKWGFGGKPPVNANDPRWVSVVEEVKHSHDCYQNDREGMITAILDPVTGTLTPQVLLAGTDRYWRPLPLPGHIDQDAIDLDVGREIYIDGIAYRIQSIGFDPLTSPPYDPTSTTSAMQWTITLDRVFEGLGNINPTCPAIMRQYAHAVGAEYVGAPFRWQEPTKLVWLSDADNVCLPTYPVRC